MCREIILHTIESISVTLQERLEIEIIVQILIVDQIQVALQTLRLKGNEYLLPDFDELIVLVDHSLQILVSLLLRRQFEHDESLITRNTIT